MIELLSKDARMSLHELSQTLGMSSTAAKKRLDKLIKDGVIVGFTTLVNSSAAGKKTYITIAHLDVASYNKIMPALRHMELEAVYENSSQNGYVLYILAYEESLNKLRNILKYVGKPAPISKVEKII